MTSRRRIAICVFTVISLVADRAPADEPDGERSDAELDEARSRYDRGIKHYNLGEFEAAIVEFKAAYELSGEPDLLFNIAQAYRLAEDYKEALFFYDSYLRLRPDAANRADVESRIAATRKLLEEQKQLQESPPQGVIPPSGADQATEPLRPATDRDDPESRTARPRSRRSTRIAAIACASAGAVLGAGSAYFAMRAKRGWDEINGLAADGGAWSPHHAAVETDATRSERLALGLAVAGGAAVVTASVLAYLGWRPEDRGAALDVRAGDGSAEVAVTWDF